MSNTKISNLSSATTPLSGSEIVPLNQSGVTDSVSVANLTAGRAVAAGSLALNGATLTESLSVAGAIRSSGAITANAPGAVLAYQGSGTSYLGAWGSTTSSYGTLSFYLASSNGALGNVYSTLTNTAFTVNPNIVPQVAGNGINFTANTPASGMTSQLLNWYEEGTWTPTVAAGVGSITSYTSSGKYTRIGRQVTATFIVAVTNNGTGLSYLTVTGQPFTAGGNTALYGYNQSSGLAITGYLTGGTMYIYTAAGLYPVATGQTLNCTIIYFI